MAFLLVQIVVSAYTHEKLAANKTRLPAQAQATHRAIQPRRDTLSYHHQPALVSSSLDATVDLPVTPHTTYNYFYCSNNTERSLFM